MADHNDGAAKGGRHPTTGRFVKGYSGGPGRPPRRTEESYLRTMAEVVTPETWRAIIDRAVADALDGDSQARGWLSLYLLGKPAGDAPSLSRMEESRLLGRLDGGQERAARTIAAGVAADTGADMEQCLIAARQVIVEDGGGGS